MKKKFAKTKITKLNFGTPLLSSPLLSSPLLYSIRASLLMLSLAAWVLVPGNSLAQAADPCSTYGGAIPDYMIGEYQCECEPLFVDMHGRELQRKAVNSAVMHINLQLLQSGLYAVIWLQPNQPSVSRPLVISR